MGVEAGSHVALTSYSTRGACMRLVAGALARAWRGSSGPRGSRALAMMHGRDYGAAIDALNSLQSNAATLEAIRKSGRTVNELNEHEMTEYLERIGHRVSRVCMPR